LPVETPFHSNFTSHLQNMVSRCAVVMMAAVAAADVVQPLPVDLHTLDGDGSEMPECSVSLLQTRMEKMRKSQVTVDSAEQASTAVKEMGEAITGLFSLDDTNEAKPKGADAIKTRMALKSTAIGKATHAIEDVKQAFSKLLEKSQYDEASEKEGKKANEVSMTQQLRDHIGHTSTFDTAAAADFWDDVADGKGDADAQEKVSAKASETSKKNNRRCLGNRYLG